MTDSSIGYLTVSLPSLEVITSEGYHPVDQLDPNLIPEPGRTNLQRVGLDLWVLQTNPENTCLSLVILPNIRTVYSSFRLILEPPASAANELPSYPLVLLRWHLYHLFENPSTLRFTPTYLQECFFRHLGQANPNQSDQRPNLCDMLCPEDGMAKEDLELAVDNCLRQLNPSEVQDLWVEAVYLSQMSGSSFVVDLVTLLTSHVRLNSLEPSCAWLCEHMLGVARQNRKNRLGKKLLELVAKWLPSDLQSSDWFSFALYAHAMGEILYKDNLRTLHLNECSSFFEKSLLFIKRSKDLNETTELFYRNVYYLGLVELGRQNLTTAASYFLIGLNSQELKEQAQLDELTLQTTIGATQELFLTAKVLSQNNLVDHARSFLARAFGLLSQLVGSDDFSAEVVEKAVGEIIRKAHETEALVRVLDPNGHLSPPSSNRDNKSLTMTLRKHLDLLATHQDGAHEILWVAITHKNSGLSIFDYDFTQGKAGLNKSIYSSFIHAVSTWGQVELKVGPAEEIRYQGYHVVIEHFPSAILVAVCRTNVGRVRDALLKFGNSFQNTFQEDLDRWEGETALFNERGVELVKDILFPVL